MSFEAGQILEDERVLNEAHGSLVYATLIEDADTVNLDNGFTIQACGTLCPQCSKLIDISLMTVSCKTGERVMCHYCSDCPLLFRSILIGKIDWRGEYVQNSKYL